MTDDFFLNFGNPMKENTIVIPEKDILKEIGLLESDSNTEDGSFKRAKDLLEKKLIVMN